MPNINRRVLPGFSLTMGYTLFYLGLLVLIPIASLFLRSASLPWSEFLQAAWSERARAAYRLTFGTAFAAALINTGLGLLVAWVLVRYTFPGRRLLDALSVAPIRND